MAIIVGDKLKLSNYAYLLSEDGKSFVTDLYSRRPRQEKLVDVVDLDWRPFRLKNFTYTSYYNKETNSYISYTYDAIEGTTFTYITDYGDLFDTTRVLDFISYSYSMGKNLDFFDEVRPNKPLLDHRPTLITNIGWVDRDSRIIGYNYWPAVGSVYGLNNISEEDRLSIFSLHKGEIFNDYVNNIASADYSHAEGFNTSATGNYSHAEGYGTLAAGDGTHAEGHNTKANNYNSHAEGEDTIAGGYASHTEGMNSKSSGMASHAEGYSIANGDYSHSEGEGTTSNGKGSHTEGNNTIATGEYSHTEGQSSKTNGTAGHAEGQETTSSNIASHAEGHKTEADGIAAHSEGEGTKALNHAAHAEGYGTRASGEFTHAEGDTTKAIGKGSHAEGTLTEAQGDYSHAEGQSTIAYGEVSHVEGYSNYSYTDSKYSHTEGLHNVNGGLGTHIEGNNNSIFDNYSHVEGSYNIIDGSSYIHVEGSKNIVRMGNNYSHIEGFENDITSSVYSHISGRQNTINNSPNSIISGYNNTLTNSTYSHLSGYNTYLEGDRSFVHSFDSKVNGTYNTVFGYNLNVEDSYSFINGYNTTTKGYKNIISAFDSTINTSYSIVIGNRNKVNTPENILIGHNIDANTSSDRPIALGYNLSLGNTSNVITVGKKIENTQSNSVIIGEGLKNNYASNAIILGRYNDDKFINNEISYQFQIGIGTSDTNRKNIFETTSNGWSYISALATYINNIVAYTEHKPISYNTNFVYVYSFAGIERHAYSTPYYSNSYNILTYSYQVPTKQYVDKLLELKDAFRFAGTFEPSNTNISFAQEGTTHNVSGTWIPATWFNNGETDDKTTTYDSSTAAVWRVTKRGWFGSYVVEGGDLLIAYADATRTSDQNWAIIETHMNWVNNTGLQRTNETNKGRILSNFHLTDSGILSYAYADITSKSYYAKLPGTITNLSSQNLQQTKREELKNGNLTSYENRNQYFITNIHLNTDDRNNIQISYGIAEFGNYLTYSLFTYSLHRKDNINNTQVDHNGITGKVAEGIETSKPDSYLNDTDAITYISEVNLNSDGILSYTKTSIYKLRTHHDNVSYKTVDFNIDSTERTNSTGDQIKVITEVNLSKEGTLAYNAYNLTHLRNHHHTEPEYHNNTVYRAGLTREQDTDVDTVLPASDIYKVISYTYTDSIGTVYTYYYHLSNLRHHHHSWEYHNDNSHRQNLINEQDTNVDTVIPANDNYKVLSYAYINSGGVAYTYYYNLSNLRHHHHLNGTAYTWSYAYLTYTTGDDLAYIVSNINFTSDGKLSYSYNVISGIRNHHRTLNTLSTTYVSTHKDPYTYNYNFVESDFYDADDHLTPISTDVDKVLFIDNVNLDKFGTLTYTAKQVSRLRNHHDTQSHDSLPCAYVSIHKNDWLHADYKLQYPDTYLGDPTRLPYNAITEEVDKILFINNVNLSKEGKLTYTAKQVSRLRNHHDTVAYSTKDYDIDTNPADKFRVITEVHLNTSGTLTYTSYDVSNFRKHHHTNPGVNKTEENKDKEFITVISKVDLSANGTLSYDYTEIGNVKHAGSAGKLDDNNEHKIWGQQYWINGLPKQVTDITGNMSGVENIYGNTTRAPYLQQTGVPTAVGSLGTAIGIGSAPSNYGMFMWGDGSGYGHIQVGRKDGTNTSYPLILQEFSGNVGIGQTSPSYKLDISGSTRISERLGVGCTPHATYRIDAAGDIRAQGWLRTTGKTGWYSDTYTGGWYMEDSNWLRNYNSKATLLDINSNNSWGIGTHRLALALQGTNSVSLLMKVKGATGTGNANIAWGITANQNGNMYIGKRTTDSLTDATGDQYVGIFSSNGLSINTLAAPGTTNHGYNTQYTLDVLGHQRLCSATSTTGAGGDVLLDFWRGQNASWRFINSEGYLKIQSNYTSAVTNWFDVFKLDYNIGNGYLKGNFGIGTTSPAYKLDVNGATRAANFISTVATGTQPYQCISETKNEHLNADMVDDVHLKNLNYCIESINFLCGTSKANITTAQFKAKLKTLGAFNYRHWTVKCSWAYASNDTITDTGCGNIQLAGAVIDVYNVDENVFTIRVLTSPATDNGSVINGEFIYRDHGSGYSPNWKRTSDAYSITHGNQTFSGGELNLNNHGGSASGNFLKSVSLSNTGQLSGTSGTFGANSGTAGNQINCLQDSNNTINVLTGGTISSEGKFTYSYTPLRIYQYHDHIGIKNMRETVNNVEKHINWQPNEFPIKNLQTFFQYTGGPISNQWWSGFSINGWDKNYVSWQLAGPSSNNNWGGRLYYRSAKSETEWNSWETVAFKSEIQNLIINSSVSKTGNQIVKNISNSDHTITKYYDDIWGTI